MGYSIAFIKGLGWSGFLLVAVKITFLIKYIFIARLLTPAELGVFGITIITISFFDSMTETGISAFLVQTQGKIEHYVSSAWILNIIRGVILCLITIILSYPISIFFNSHSAFLLLLVSSIIPLGRGFINPAVVKFQKSLEFEKEFIYRLILSIFDFAITIVLLYLMRNVFALIFSLILSTLFEAIISLILIKPRPSIVVEIKRLKEIFSFGKWLTLVVSVNYFAQQIDSIIIGRILGTTSLGVYQLAQKFSLQAMSDASGIFSKVTFPLFSRIQNDVQRSRRALVKLFLLVSLIFGTITVFLFIFSHQIILTFAGEKWLAAVIPLQYMSLTGLITAYMTIVTSLFLANARQDITAKMIICRLVIISVIIYPLTHNFGIIGASIASFISYLFVLPLSFLGLRKILKNK